MAKLAVTSPPPLVWHSLLCQTIKKRPERKTTPCCVLPLVRFCWGREHSLCAGCPSCRLQICRARGE